MGNRIINTVGQVVSVMGKREVRQEANCCGVDRTLFYPGGRVSRVVLRTAL